MYLLNIHINGSEGFYKVQSELQVHTCPSLQTLIGKWLFSNGLGRASLWKYLFTDGVAAGSCVKQALRQTYKYRDVLSVVISIARVKGVGSGVGRESFRTVRQAWPLWKVSRKEYEEPQTSLESWDSPVGHPGSNVSHRGAPHWAAVLCPPIPASSMRHRSSEAFGAVRSLQSLQLICRSWKELWKAALHRSHSHSFESFHMCRSKVVFG